MIKKLFSNKRNIIIISILGILLVIGTTYALINWTSNNYNVAIKSSCMNINYTKGQNIDTNITAINENSIINNNNTITVNSSLVFSSVDIELSSTCDTEGFATVEVNVSNLSNQLKSGGVYSDSLRYIVVEYDPNIYPNLTISELSGNTFNIASKGSINKDGTIDVYYKKYLAPGDKLNCLIFFYADNSLFGNNVLDLSFDGNVGARVEQFVPTPITDFTYTLTNGNVRITKYNGTANKVNVASKYTINGTEYNTVVHGGVFKDKTTIREVVFADGITADSGFASLMFSGCTNLKKVTGLPNNITTMSNTFEGCTSLITAPEISNSVTSMFRTFYGCKSLITAPTIPNSVTDMSRTFSGCTSLTGTIRINSSDVTRTSGSSYHPFYNTSKTITVEVPQGSTTYTTINTNKPSNVTINTFTS